MRSSFLSPNVYRRQLENHFDNDEDEDSEYDDLRGTIPYIPMVNNLLQTRTLEQNVGIPISVEAKTAAGMLKERLLGRDDDDKKRKRNKISKPKKS